MGLLPNIKFDHAWNFLVFAAFQKCLLGWVLVGWSIFGFTKYFLSETHFSFFNTVCVAKLSWKRTVGCTVWKFKEFSVIQILREINFWESRTSKTAGFAIFLGSELGEFGNFQPSKSIQIPKNQNSEPLKLQKWQILHF